MKRDRKKLIGLFFWGILFLMCMAVSVFYMIRDTPENMPAGQMDMEPAEAGEMDLPSGVIEEGESD